MPMTGLTSSEMPPTNTINDVYVQNDTVWFATGKGPSYTLDGGATWMNLAGLSVFDSKGISAVAMKNNLVWMAAGYTTTIDGTDYQTGGGLRYSFDHGLNWNSISQPVDTGSGKYDTVLYGSNKIPALRVTVPQQNITYDIALTKSAVWIASWAGMLRKSCDSGKTWQVVVLPTDNMDAVDPSMTLSFTLSPLLYNNHLLFSVVAEDDSTIWAGTAGGINKSTDGGVSWTKFSHQNQFQPISGNFVVALNVQKWKGTTVIWAATNNASDADEERGLSFSSDGGNSWQTALIGAFTHNITSKDSVVYVSTDQGVYRSSDFGSSWTCSGTIIDKNSYQRFLSSELYCAGVQGDTVWVGGSEGIAYTLDNATNPFGSSWKINRTAEMVGTAQTTYAYPNPFSPDNDGSVRIHFSTKSSSGSSPDVDIRIFNFAMQPIRTLLQNASRPGGAEYDEMWNGADDRGRTVANGVYFYSVSVGGQSSVWGKILVIR
jgi:hypothetical protein